jgi:hypothetical protein
VKKQPPRPLDADDLRAWDDAPKKPQPLDAERINVAADGPVVDGLTVAALAYVLAASVSLLGMVSVVVEQLRMG